mmetsp:Transcript_50260/g.116682  ORF Transcript_50260/g.116682 Transcript_50260/m.116682 type:complete len:238 (+) Transcript_50260:65-778(+)
MGDSDRLEMTKAAPLYSNQRLLDYDWGTVTMAWLQKFPDPKLKQVSSVETVDRVLNEPQRTLHVRRLFNCSFDIPAIVQFILGKRVQVVCVEEAHWDLKRRRLTVYGHNETLKSVVRIDEVCCFTEVAPGQTLYTQSGTVVYRRGVLSTLLMPVVNEIFAGICQRTAHKGMSAMVSRVQREAAGLGGVCNEAPVQPASEGRRGLGATACGVSLMGLALLGWGCWLRSGFRPRWNPEE